MHTGKLIYIYMLETLALIALLIRLLPLLIISVFESINLLPVKCKSVKNKIILITGGGNGLGCEMAIAFAKHENQCRILVVDIDLAAAKKTADYLKKMFNVNAYAYHCDVSEYESVVKLYESVIKEVGYVDILVNNAGLITFISLREKEWTNIDRILKVNLHSHFWMTRVFLEDMIKRKSGHIVGVSSMAGHYPCPSMITYGATKHGVNGFMKCLSNELHCDGHSQYVKTTLVCPYFMDTRRELKEYLRLIVPMMKTSDAAYTIVQGILKEKDEIYVPKAWSLLKYLTLMPTKVYNNIVQYLCRNTKTNKFKVSY